MTGSLLDLIPSVVDMVKIEDQIHQIKSLSVFTILYQALKPHLGAYQYVFLDYPPNLYTVLKNALFAADYCVIPYVPDFEIGKGKKFLSTEKKG